ncbi:MAG: sulfatase-like hydrolase/transferase, partial [Clostridia bacterium]
MKNILFVMTDQQRADQTGYAGVYDTPNLDAIGRAARFDCCSGNPICSPARSSLLTGRYARQVGMVTMSGDLDYQIPTMPQALQKAGYTTYGVGKFHFLQTWPWGTERGEGWDFLENEVTMKRFGFDFIWETAGKQQIIQNYDHYCAYLDEKGLLDGYRDFILESGGANGDTANHNYDRTGPFPYDMSDYVDVVTGRIARQKLENHPADKPFYMFLSFCGPHKPYDPPREYLDRYNIERNDNFVLEEGQILTEDEKEAIYRERRAAKAMLKLIDDQVGLVLDVLDRRGMRENTLLVFASDHGDMLGDHCLIQKGVPWKQSVMVPLHMALPGAQAVGDTGALVEQTDVTATMLDYAGQDPVMALTR